MKTILVSIVLISFFLLATFFLIGYLKPKPAGILIKTVPESNVYVNGNLLGRTPINTTFKAGNISLKMVPDDLENKLVPYETDLNLFSGIKTVIKWNFGELPEFSSGSIVSFERNNIKEASLVVVSTPDNLQVSLDGVSKGFSPVKISSITPGEHQLEVKSSGYIDQALVVRPQTGYKLTVFVKLAKVPELPEIKTIPERFVEILSTPTGFLRVRSEPGGKGLEVAKASPGDKFLLLEEDPETGWYKIELGWISNEFSQIILTETPE